MPFAGYFFNNGFISLLALLSVIFLIGVPLFRLLMMLSKRLFKKSIGNSLHMRAGLWGLWAISLVSLLFIVIGQIRNFNIRSEVTQQVDLPAFDSDTLFLSEIEDLNTNNLIMMGPLRLGDNELINDHIHYDIVQGNSDQYELSIVRRSNGRTRLQAENFAQAIEYNVQTSGNKLSFPASFSIPKGTKFRGQHIDVVLKVPVGKTVKFDRTIGYNLHRFRKNREVDHPHRNSTDHYWTMEENGFVSKAFLKNSNHRKSFDDYANFSQLQLEGSMKVDIEQSDQFDIEVTGRPKYTNQLEVDQIDDILTMQLSADHVHAPVRVTIKMPKLSSLDIKKTDQVQVSGFTQEHMTLKSDSPNELRALVNVDSLTVRQDGRSDIDLRGKGTFLKASLKAYAKLDADRFAVNYAELNMCRSCEAALSVSDTLYRKGEQTIHASQLRVDGEPGVVDLY